MNTYVLALSCGHGELNFIILLIQVDDPQIKHSSSSEGYDTINIAKKEAAAIVDRARLEGAAQASSILEVCTLSRF